MTRRHLTILLLAVLIAAAGARSMLRAQQDRA